MEHFKVPPSAEDEKQVRQLSITNLSQVELGFCDLQHLQTKLKPRRRLQDTTVDRADGLDILIQKTKAIGLKEGEDGLAPNEDGNQWLEALYCKEERLLWGVKKIRKYVCGDGSDEHAKELIRFGVLERLIYFLDETVDSDVLFEVLWIFTNIAAGPTAHTTYLVDIGCLPMLGKLLNHPLGSIRTQAAWSIGNIIGDREGYRDLVLEQGLLPCILQIWKGAELDEDSQKESFRIALWIVDNMCRYKPNWLLMRPAFELIPMVLQQDDPSILKECCWAVARILHQSGRNDVIDSMITPQFCTRLVEILRWNRQITTHPILRALINLASSRNPVHLKYIVNAGLLPQLQEYLSSKSNQSFEIFCVQIIGNLSIHQEYALKVVSCYSLCQWLVKTMGTTKDPELRYEVGITIKNMAYHRNPVVTGILAQIGLVRIITNCLLRAIQFSKMQFVLLETIQFMLQTDRPPKGGSQHNLMDPKSSMFDYFHTFRASGFFSEILAVYVNSIDANLEEMEHDLQDFDEETDSDEEETAQVSVSFDVTNPTQFKKRKGNVKQKVAYLSLYILKTIFNNEFEASIKQSQIDNSMCDALNYMAVGNSNSKVTDLVDIFGKLNYSAN